MPRKYLLHALIVVCVTLLVSLWIIGDRLCEIRISQGGNEYAAFLNCDFKSKPWAGETPPDGVWLRAL